MIFLFEIIFIEHTRNVYVMVEDAAGLDYIDKVAKSTEEIIFHEKSVQIAGTLVTAGIESLWTLTCTVSKAFCL